MISGRSVVMQLSCLVVAAVALARVCCGEFTPKVSRIAEGNAFSYNVQAFDDSTTIIRSLQSGISVSRDNGRTWKRIKKVKADYAYVDPFHSHSRAIAMSFEKPGRIYITGDMGENWNRAVMDLEYGENASGGCTLFSHPTSEDYMIAQCDLCESFGGPEPEEELEDESVSFGCKRYSLISKDGGKSFSRVPAAQDADLVCYFGVSSPQSSLFQDDRTVYCLERVGGSNGGERPAADVRSRLFYTKDFGKTCHDVEQFQDMMISSILVLKSFLVVFTQEDRFNEFSNKEVWISTDGTSFRKAHLPTQLRQVNDFGVFEDSMGKIFLPIVTGEDSRQSSQVYVSDSQGLKFSPIPWTTDNSEGFLMVAESKYLPGTLLAQFEGIRRSSSKAERPRITAKTKISFDGGFTWTNLRVVDDPENKKDYPCDIDDVENCSLHIPLALQRQPDAAPGIIMQVGFVGDGTSMYLEEADLFLSTDGGRTWKKTSSSTLSLFAFGDMGNIMVRCPFDPNHDGDPQSEFYYSLDQGQTWNEYQLEKAIIPTELISTTPDGSGANFILKGFEGKQNTNFLYAIDFNEVFDGKKCGDDDFETFYVADGECVNGVRRKYSRRKSSSTCLIRKPFVNLEWEEEICEQCSEKDYECSFEFSRNGDGQCQLDYQLLSVSDVCKGSTEGQLTLKPMQLMKGDKCQRELEIKPVEVSCGSLSEPEQHSSEVSVKENEFDSNIVFYQYFDTLEHETIVIGTMKNDIYISHDSGQTIKKFDMDDKIIEVVFNPYFNSSAYFFGMSGTLYVTKDRGNSFHETKLPQARQLGFPLEFHAKDENTFIYYGGKDCDSMFSPECHAVAYITTDGGQSFRELLSNAIHCEFSGSQFKSPYNENQIICQVKEKHSQIRALISSNDFFINDKTVLYENIIGYMSTGEFTVVAIPHENGELRAYVTVDGREFAEAKFPMDATAEKQEAFTVLGSQTGSIFLHLSTSNEKGKELGVLMKSNSNGTSFVTLEKAVNRDQHGMVDFEKVQGLEGIILVNTVSNREDVLRKGEAKKLQSRITFNDGSDWSYIKPPKTDSEGKRYDCSKKPLEECALHLHSYSERTDIRDTFSSGSALGLLFGVGNVGSHLLPEDECSTFFSSDGGESWKEFKKGAYQWEYGDHGGVLVLVPKNVPTNILSYSLDSGKTWKEFKFTEERTIVQDIVTVPGDSALRFLLLSQSTSVRGGSTKTFSIDFTGSFKKQCVFNSEEPAHDDFDYLPLGESATKCLFGHRAKYLRKINNDCYVGNVPLSDYIQITTNCSCTRQDYECDYNFERSIDGTCKLVTGLSPSDPSDVCRKSDAVEYFKPSGYRKIPLSTCEGGLKLDAVSDPMPCPGKEAEFNEKYGIRGSSFFIIFFVPFVIVALLAWFVYERGIRRNGGFARFGEIRLGDDSLIENNGTDRAVNLVVKSGLYAVSGFYAGYQLAKRSFVNAAAKVSERFGRRRGPTYSSLLHDQFLDDADDLLEGHDDDASDLGNFLESEANFEIDEDNADDSGSQQPYSDDVPPAAEADDSDRGHSEEL